MTWQAVSARLCAAAALGLASAIGGSWQGQTTRFSLSSAILFVHSIPVYLYLYLYTLTASCSPACPLVIFPAQVEP
jgi:hypothetical protein